MHCFLLEATLKELRRPGWEEKYKANKNRRIRVKESI